MAAQRASTLVGCAAAVLLAMVVAASAQTCATNTMYTLEPCLSAVEGRFPPGPTDDCCYVIRTTEPTCLCNAVSGYAKSPSVNLKAALNLPKLCGRLVPAGFTCAGIPVPSAEVPATRKLKL